jgi:SAM-dependent methyltransferase
MSLDPWSHGERYEPYIGRWSRLVAQEFLAWLAVVLGQRWLDVGCGTGALTQTILRVASPSAVTGIDPSAAYLARARASTSDARAEFMIGDAERLPVEENSYDAVVSGLALNFIPDPARAAAEMVRVTRLGGTIAAYVWDYADQMQLLRRFWDAAVVLDPQARELDEGSRFPLCAPEPLERLFAETGMREVVVQGIDVCTVFRDFDDYWAPFLGGQGPAPSYVLSLDEAQRAALRERIQASLPVAADGSISLRARAWAVKGTR